MSLAAFFLIIIFLVVYVVTVLLASSSFIAESAEKNALICFEEDIDRANALAEAHFENLYEIADKAKQKTTKEEVDDLIESYRGAEQFGDLRFYLNGESRAPSGSTVDFETSNDEEIRALSSSDSRGVTSVYHDKSSGLDCIAFFIPVRGCEFIDGILSIVPARNIISVGDVINDKASVVTIIVPNEVKYDEETPETEEEQKEGMVLADARAESFSATVGNNFYKFIDNVTDDKSKTNELRQAISENEKGAFSISTSGGDYVLAFSPLSSFDGNVMLIAMSESEGLIAPELTYVRHIVNLLAISIIAIIVGAIYAMLYHKRTSLALSIATLVDPKLDCPNTEKFKLTAKEHISVIRRRYSVVLISIRNFIYLGDQLGEAQSTEVLKSLAKIINSLCNIEECFGYAGDGKFLLLTLHANPHSETDKIKLIETIINREEILAEKGVKIRFAAGIYNVFSGYRRSVQEMIDCATTACGISEESSKVSYTLFTEEVRAEIARNEKIESIMETALATGEFRLFLQPKYDVRHDTIHSAEALVRWFDTERGEYKFPGEFIPLFETNGFIVKLDHFVYIQVLEYLSGAAKRGEKVVPIAVNVSRVTATSPDFINFYVGNKKKYGIPDNFVTLELTESFAMEDYDKISSIISALHNGGMRCSIDDFGSGYSSFSILKQITVDELKLDSVFMKRGIDVRRDDKLLETIIDLAKSMGMSVVQEGVETKEMFDKVTRMGCDVIQGYYYAKAISLEEFRIFIKTNTSIKYKSLVK